MNLSSKKTLAVIALAASMQVMAQTTSTATAPADSSTSILKNFASTYYFWYNGPTSNELDSTTTRDNTGVADGSVFIDNSHQLRYKFSNGLTAAVNPRFRILMDPAETENDGDNYQALNTRLYLNGFQLTDSDAPVTGTINLMLETADAQKEIKMVTADGVEEVGRNTANPGIILLNNINIGPAHSLTMYSRVRWHFYDNSEIAITKPYYDVLFNPDYTYMINDTFGLNISHYRGLKQMNGYAKANSKNKPQVEADPMSTVGDDGNNNTYFGPVFNIKGASFNPFIQVSHAAGSNEDSTIVGAQLSGAFF